jgi:hypothetical protein
MTHSALASRYASALVDVATGPKTPVDPHQLLRELRGFEEVLAGSAELRTALASPSVPPARKRAVVGAIGAKLGVSRVARNFLFVLTDHRRIGMLTEVLEAFDLLSDEGRNQLGSGIGPAAARGRVARIRAAHRKESAHAFRGGSRTARRAGGPHRFHRLRRLRTGPTAGAGQALGRGVTGFRNHRYTDAHRQKQTKPNCRCKRILGCFVLGFICVYPCPSVVPSGSKLEV